MSEKSGKSIIGFVAAGVLAIGGMLAKHGDGLFRATRGATRHADDVGRHLDDIGRHASGVGGAAADFRKAGVNIVDDAHPAAVLRGAAQADADSFIDAGTAVDAAQLGLDVATDDDD